ncbi:helix-turn-helix transcriptional regulator [Pyxidicoccus fallax]|uniref:Helix-turn-helix transcriptional regulator n=1 Tax=Pyxidicoccus fallax TaxID=394095 RepID=A0A848L9V6_9BACT|nr:helix-turn-helix domain-containing protein [Pyxidicoccus fallax]NMO13635.1 helix-turn-helix transcriptional regulator [Pyxidicoccus fallax]NPC82677.1 helix-turn-helix transcriptional regulator [Pyxidicoccus fallax]
MPRTFDRRAIGDAAQIRLLSSPVRQELVDTLAALGGEASVADLAEQLGRPADGLYYHLRVLHRGGLVREVESAGGGEQRYRLAGSGEAPLRLAYRTGRSGNLAALGRFARSLLGIATRDFEAALRLDDVVVQGPRRELWTARNKGWLSPGDVEEVNRLIERLCELTSQPRAPGRERLMSLAFVLAPIRPRAKRRSPPET